MRISRTGTAAVVTAAGLLLVAAPGAEAAAYRYWTYWQGASDTWTFASAGPAALVPADGSVEGWRFAVTTQAGGQSDAPSVEPSFEAICGDTTAQPDRKRVALVIDPGSAASAPQGQRPPPASSTCIVAELDATGYQVLRSAVVVRTEGGLVCGIAGYPTGECAPVVDEAAAGPANAASPDPSASQAMPSVAAPTDAEGSDTPWWTIAVLAVVAVIGGLLAWRRPRG